MSAPLTPSEKAHRIAQSLPAIEWITDAPRVARLSQDFSWFSPVLKRELEGKHADVVARPANEEDIRLIVAACATEGIPLTVRGSGTGNYGQSTPLHGGVVLDLSAFNAFCWSQGPVGRAQAGMRLADFDNVVRPTGHELRWLPSTFRTATLGGLFGGGFGGAGSINYGPLAAPGNVLAVKVMSVEPNPQVKELRGADAMLFHHTYGTNGIVLEIEVSLAPAVEWTECVASFSQFDAALDFCSRFTKAPGMVKKEVSLLAAPIPSYMMPLAAVVKPDAHCVLLVIGPSADEATTDMVQSSGGEIVYRKTAEEVRTSKRTLIEFTWNHTTLHALKVDKGFTYIQTGFDPSRYLEQVKTLNQALNGEVLMHLEFIRTKEGDFNCSGLQLIRYSTEARLNEIMDIHRSHGVMVNNPHVYILEDGKQNNKLHPGVIAMKERFDPRGLLNPGKMRAWNGRETSRL